MPYDVVLRTVPPTPLAVVRVRAEGGSFSSVVPEACGRVRRLVKELGITGAGRQIALYGGVPGEAEVGVELEAPIVATGALLASQTPGGEVLSTTHFGPYHGLVRAHRALCDWATAQGRRMAGPNWELYGHWMEEWNHDPSLIRTEVCHLLA